MAEPRTHTPQFKVQKTRNGQGVFATRSFAAGRSLFPLKGRIIHWKKLKQIGGKTLDNAYRYGPQTYLSPEGELGDFVNHSCKPNAGVAKKGRTLFIKSLRDIEEGEEILIDYSTLIAEDDIWTMRCNCGARGCRKKVKGFGTLPLKAQNAYREKGIVLRHISLT